MDIEKSLAKGNSINRSLPANNNGSADGDILPSSASRLFPTSSNENDIRRSTYRSSSRPLVEWVYPSGHNGHRHEHGDIDGVHEPSVQEESSTDITANSTETDSTNTLIIDPSQTTTVPVIDGEIVKPKRCYIKVCGFRICDDNFVTRINPWILIMTIVFVLSADLTRKVFNSHEKASETGSIGIALNNVTSATPTMAPSFDTRTINITEQLFSVSGDVILEKGSSQNKALKWILYEDRMNLWYGSPNLVQRYVLMVLYYSMSGEKWDNNNGFGSGWDECAWYGVFCTDSKVVVIWLDSNEVDGRIPQEIGYVKHLRDISFNSNWISGSIPSSIGMLEDLEYLSLVSNNLSGTIPTEIVGCTKLKTIFLQNNKLTGTISSFLENLSSLEGVRLNNNKYSGTIPSILSNLQSLKVLVLMGNELTGTIPSELGMCKSLETLQVRANKLEGTIPSSLGNLGFLARLNLSENTLTGTIPEELGMLSNLIQLSMNDNRFRGIIPETLGSLSKLNGMRLSNNMINGTIPSSFENFNDLNILELHGNMMTGEVNEKICGLPLVIMTSDCLGEEPAISCSCCTECF